MMEKVNYLDKVDLTIPKAKLEISKAITKELENNKYTVREFAEMVEMNHPQIIRVTSGKNYNIDTLLKILDGLNLQITIQPRDKQ